MRKFFYSLGGLCLLMMACQSDDMPIDRVADGEEGNVNFTITVPDVLTETRTSGSGNRNSALGGITNVDMEAYDLRYQLAVYRIEGTEYMETIAPLTQVVDRYVPVTYTLRLTPNRTYQVVVWADFVKQGETGDLHYDTADFRQIVCKDAPDKQLNDESRDAYFVTKKITVGDDGLADALVLQRPFAKLRVVATDWAYGQNEMPDRIQITYKNCRRFTGIDALTGVSAALQLGETEDTGTPGDEAGEEEAESPLVYTGTLDTDNKEYGLNYDQHPHNRTLAVDYLMTDKTEQTPIHFDFEALQGETSIRKHSLVTDIPIKRNWLTTVIGNLLTVDGTFTVSIDEHLTNEWVTSERWWDPAVITPTEPAYDEATKTYTIYTRDEFAWLPDHVAALSGKTISLQNDIDMSGVNWKPIYTANYETYTVLGNGHTLRNFTMDGTFGTVYEYSALGGWIKLYYNAYTGVWGNYQGVMKDLTFENITINGLAGDEVHYDTEGNPVDHSKEEAYFAGCIGYVGANWSTTVNLQNVHAKHVTIKASGTSQNVGGLVGWIGMGGGSGSSVNSGTWLKNCSATDVHLIGTSQAGGLVGQILSGRYVGLFDCSAEDVYLRVTRYVSTTGAFIGQINNGVGMEINNCTVPTHVEYLLNSDGSRLDITPTNKYYGQCSKNAGSIKIVEGAVGTD